MSLSREPLDRQRIEEGLASLDGWSYDGEKIRRTYEFEGYPAAAEFVAKAAEEAEKLNHHPDLLLTYGKVEASVNTHDAGGITEFDLELARRLNPLAMR